MSQAVRVLTGCGLVLGAAGFFLLGPRAGRHSALTACKWRPSALPVLTYFRYAALRVTENHHFRHVII